MLKGSYKSKRQAVFYQVANVTQMLFDVAAAFIKFAGQRILDILSKIKELFFAKTGAAADFFRKTLLMEAKMLNEQKQRHQTGEAGNN